MKAVLESLGSFCQSEAVEPKVPSPEAELRQSFSLDSCYIKVRGLLDFRCMGYWVLRTSRELNRRFRELGLCPSSGEKFM